MKITHCITCLIVLMIFFTSCSVDNSYRIDKGQVGKLNKKTKIRDLKSIFSTDSIKRNLSLIEEEEETSFFNDNDEYEIYSKDGDKLLSIIPVEQKDSTSKLKSIQIFNPIYKTEKGICLLSTFKDVKENYMINKVETTLTSAMLYIDELNATIAIDKEEMGLHKFSREEISLDQIPDVSKIKYFTIWFN